MRTLRGSPYRDAEICVFTSSSGSWKRTFASTRQRLHVAPSLIQMVPIGCQSVPLSWTVNHGPAPQKRPSSHIRNQMCFRPTRTAVPFASIGCTPTLSVVSTWRFTRSAIRRSATCARTLPWSSSTRRFM